ncbi:NADPH-dependent F420 reductase [soil metagenome]
MMTAGPLPTVGVLGGTGPQGRGLGLRLALAGYAVVLGSRTPERAVDVAGCLHDEHGVDPDLLAGAANNEAAARDVVIVAVPFDGVRALLEPMGDLLAGTVVISCVNRLGFDADGPHPIPVEEGSAAELIAVLAPRARIVGAFHHVPAARLTGASIVEMDVLVTGDDDAACAVACALADALPGMRGVRAGPLRLTRPVEELTAVVLAVNKRHRIAAGVRLAGLRD